MIRMEAVRRSILAAWAANRASRRISRQTKPFRAAAMSLVWPWLLTGLLSAVPPNEIRTETAARSRSCCWILMDIESFYCAPCLEPLLALCRALPARVQEERVRGILVYGSSGGERSELRSRIVLKKWLGFRKAHDILFPAVADTGPFFRGFLKDGIVVLLVHEERSVLASYPLPLKSGQLEEIVEILSARAEGP